MRVTICYRKRSLLLGDKWMRKKIENKTVFYAHRDGTHFILFKYSFIASGQIRSFPLCECTHMYVAVADIVVGCILGFVSYGFVSRLIWMHRHWFELNVICKFKWGKNGRITHISLFISGFLLSLFWMIHAHDGIKILIHFNELILARWRINIFLY